MNLRDDSYYRQLWLQYLAEKEDIIKSGSFKLTSSSRSTESNSLVRVTGASVKRSKNKRILSSSLKDSHKKRSKLPKTQSEDTQIQAELNSLSRRITSDNKNQIQLTGQQPHNKFIYKHNEFHAHSEHSEAGITNSSNKIDSEFLNKIQYNSYSRSQIATKNSLIQCFELDNSLRLNPSILHTELDYSTVSTKLSNSVCNSSKSESDSNVDKFSSVVTGFLTASLVNELIEQTSLHVLCCGMAYVTADHPDKSLVQQNRIRLQHLSNLKRNGNFKYCVRSVNVEQKESECESNMHTQTTFNGLGAKYLCRKLVNCGWNWIDCIFLDYYRFSATSMTNQRAILDEMVPIMIEQGIITTRTLIYIPNLPDLFLKFFKRFQQYTDRMALSAEQYPLYVITSEIENYLEYPNSSQLKGLDEQHPFILVRFHCLP